MKKDFLCGNVENSYRAFILEIHLSCPNHWGMSRSSMSQTPANTLLPTRIGFGGCFHGLSSGFCNVLKLFEGR